MCAADRAKTTRKCKSRRDRIRAKARADIEAAKEFRREARRHYSAEFGTGGGMRKARPKRYSRAESDSLAMHSIPPELHDIWTEDRKRYSYDDPPDQRALAFLEYVDKHPKDIEERMVAAYEDAYTDDYWAEQEKMAWQARA